MRVALLLAALSGLALTSPATEVWRFDNTEIIAGHRVALVGAPRIAEAGGVKGTVFDGAHDGVIVPAIPIARAREWTVEILFRPATEGPVEQKVLFAQDDVNGWRFLLETRLNQKKGKWSLDTFVSTGGPKPRGGPVEMKRSYLAGQWHWIALRYNGKTVAQFVNCRKDFEIDWKYEPIGDGKTSLGMRPNQPQWFAGAIAEARFHRVALADEKLARVD
jgi:hypothetical protein